MSEAAQEREGAAGEDFSVVRMSVDAEDACHGRADTHDTKTNVKPLVFSCVVLTMANHLASEKSPYLLQHANNPVDWYPWGAEAFEKARREDKPIFLSIGYSTCHWCHVMERESFENEQIAGLLNAHFVPVKVDREERPDVDRIYMSFVQATTGSGGWPMSVFLTPELKPFYGGTYFPPDNRYGRPGFTTVLNSLARAWSGERDKINQSSEGVIERLREYGEPAPGRGVALDQSVLDSAYQYFRRTFDAKHGGFGDAPKFPRPVVLNFLFRYYERTRNEEALEMALTTLRAMAEGGMNDQLGGGFHRYSVDELWFLPHFEKMLYDQAQLTISYLEAFQITQDPFYAAVARNTCEYVLRDMTDGAGGFYSAEDADSATDPAHPHEKAEGAFYVWTRKELDDILGEQDGAVFAYRYGAEREGNVHNDPHGEFPEKNILFVSRELKDANARFHREAEELAASLEHSRKKLLEHRAKRVRPHLDDKVLTAWNGLMISAFAKAAQVLDEPRYARAARTAADFVLSRMYDADKHTLLRRYRDGSAAIPGFLDDYAFFVQALLDLYETEFRLADLDVAMALCAKMQELFEDPQGGFFGTAEGADDLVMRMKDDYDGAEPSGNAIALLDLVRLAQITDRAEYHDAVQRTLQGLGPRIAQQSVAVPQMLVGLSRHLAPKRQIVIAGDAGAEETRALLRIARGRFLPNSSVLLIDSEETRLRLTRFSVAFGEMRALNGAATAFVCENFACQLPTSESEKFAELLQ